MDGTPRKSFTVTGRSGDPESIYDTFTYLNTAAPQQLLFQQFAGRTLDQTNMTDAGKLPTGKSLVVQSINTYIYYPPKMTNAIMLELYAFLAQTTVEFIKENRAPSFTKTIAMMMGISSLLQIVPTAAADNIPVIMPFYRGRMKINTRALDLGSNQTFFMRLTTQIIPLVADLNTLQVKFEIDGLMSKKVTA